MFNIKLTTFAAYHLYDNLILFIATDLYRKNIYLIVYSPANKIHYCLKTDIYKFKEFLNFKMKIKDMFYSNFDQIYKVIQRKNFFYLSFRFKDVSNFNLPDEPIIPSEIIRT